MATKRQKTKVGLFLIVCFALIGGILASLSEVYENPGTPFEIEFKESIQGLYNGAIVTYLGVEVGKVRRISVTPESTALVEVVIDPTAATLRKGVEAQLSLYSFAAGTMAVALIAPKEPGPELPAGSRIPTKPSTITAISAQIEDLMANVNGISDAVRKGLEGMEEGDLNAIIEKVDKALDSGNAMLDDGKTVVADVRDVVKKVSERIDGLLDEVETLSADLRKLSGNADEFVVVAKDKLEQFDVQSAQTSINEILADLSGLAQKADDALAGLDDLTADALGEVDNVEFSLRQTLIEATTTFTELQGVLQQLRQDPASLLRGRGPVQEPGR